MSTKWTITRLTCAVMLHNQTTMKVSMVIQGKRYSQEQCSVQYSCEILWSLENECSSANSSRTSETSRPMQKCSSNCDIIDSTLRCRRDQCVTRLFQSLSDKCSTEDFIEISFRGLPSKCACLRQERYFIECLKSATNPCSSSQSSLVLAYLKE